jgi:hypothetical protein
MSGPLGPSIKADISTLHKPDILILRRPTCIGTYLHWDLDRGCEGAYDIAQRSVTQLSLKRNH